jgi:hypothetical protein
MWAEGATYTDPSVHAGTAEELLAYIANVLAHRPGVKVVRAGAVEVHHGITLPEGLDIAELSADGNRIRWIV